LPVLHRDRDFSLLAKVSPLEAISIACQSRGRGANRR
jgi:hypothetical protein